MTEPKHEWVSEGYDGILCHEYGEFLVEQYPNGECFIIHYITDFDLHHHMKNFESAKQYVEAEQLKLDALI